MIENVEAAKQDNMKTQEGIGLFKISYEMDVANSSRDHNYVAGVIAYTSEEAVNTLLDFGRKKIKGFKGMRINEVAFEGGCHAISDTVKHAILRTAVMDGIMVPKEDHDILIAEASKSVKKPVKKSIIPKDKKE
jgi:hypothetical protein